MRRLGIAPEPRRGYKIEQKRRGKGDRIFLKHVFHWTGVLQGARWEALAVKGARKQRVLWASTSTKNLQYRDVMDVEELNGPDTVNAMPPVTLEAFRDYERVRASLEEDLHGAHDTMEMLAQMHISMTEVTEKLLDEGVRWCAEPFGKRLDALLPREV